MNEVQFTRKLKTNIVTGSALRKVQKEVLNRLSEVLMNTAGPYGSNTMLLMGNMYTNYTKDGHRTLGRVKIAGDIEHSIIEELVQVTSHVASTVGDGTTTTVRLAAALFNKLCDDEELSKIPPRVIIEMLKTVAADMKDVIKENGKQITLDDIYKIAYVSSNGNEEVANNICEIYKEYGFEVFIDVAISNTEESLVKSYDGLVLDKGIDEPAFINNTENRSAQIRDARIYAFDDPIDTLEMGNFLNAIIEKNIIAPMNDGSGLLPITPTVILAPKISRDMSSSLEALMNYLYDCDRANRQSSKPPIAIIVGYDPVQYSDITKICKCKRIRKYIDDRLQTADIEKGVAPTLETVNEFCGRAELVEADIYKTKFINPTGMFVMDEDEYVLDDDGNRIMETEYKTLLAFLKDEITTGIEHGEKPSEIAAKKRRYNTLRGSMVDYYIGGITVTDRDSLRDAVEDAVLNCRSAAKNGVGFACNFEGLKSTAYLLDESAQSSLYYKIVKIINNAYCELIDNMYSTSSSRFEKYSMDENMIALTLEKGCPMNLITGEFDGTILSSIDTDIVIIDALAKIISIMFTANQALTNTEIDNVYCD